MLKACRKTQTIQFMLLSDALVQNLTMLKTYILVFEQDRLMLLQHVMVRSILHSTANTGTHPANAHFSIKKTSVYLPEPTTSFTWYTGNSSTSVYQFSCFSGKSSDFNEVQFSSTLCQHVKVQSKSPIVNIALSQLCDSRAWCSSPFAGLWAGSELQTQLSYMGGRPHLPIYCRYVPGKLYCLVTEAHVCVNNLPRVVSWQWNGRGRNLRPRDH